MRLEKDAVGGRILFGVLEYALCSIHGSIGYRCWRGMLVLLLLLIPFMAMAHDGPPFPIIVDQNVGPCVICLDRS